MIRDRLLTAGILTVTGLIRTDLGIGAHGAGTSGDVDIRIGIFIVGITLVL